jgi:hypothetical protein
MRHCKQAHHRVPTLLDRMYQPVYSQHVPTLSESMQQELSRSETLCHSSCEDYPEIWKSRNILALLNPTSKILQRHETTGTKTKQALSTGGERMRQNGGRLTPVTPNCFYKQRGRKDRGMKHQMDQWTKGSALRANLLPATLQKTRDLLEIYVQDLRYTKQSLLNNPSCSQFPETEWLNILSGRAVNLDTVLTSIYALEHDARHSQHFGDLKVHVGPAKPAGVVDSFFKWTIAWERTKIATIFAFPHWADELRTYMEHISELFTGWPESEHYKIINYDKGVWVKVAQ